MNITYRRGASEHSLTMVDGEQVNRIDLSSWDNGKLRDYMKRVFNWRNSGMVGYPPIVPT